MDACLNCGETGTFEMTGHQETCTVCGYTVPVQQEVVENEVGAKGHVRETCIGEMVGI